MPRFFKCVACQQRVVHRTRSHAVAGEREIGPGRKGDDGCRARQGSVTRGLGQPGCHREGQPPAGGIGNVVAFPNTIFRCGVIGEIRPACARSGLIFERQGQARLHLKSKPPCPTNGVQFTRRAGSIVIGDDPRNWSHSIRPVR